MAVWSLDAAGSSGMAFSVGCWGFGRCQQGGCLSCKISSNCCSGVLYVRLYMSAPCFVFQVYGITLRGAALVRTADCSYAWYSWGGIGTKPHKKERPFSLSVSSNGSVHHDAKILVVSLHHHGSRSLVVYSFYNKKCHKVLVLSSAHVRSFRPLLHASKITHVR